MNSSSDALNVSNNVGISLVANDYKIGDVKKIVIGYYGDIRPYFDSVFLNPQDRLIEVEVKSVSKVKEQEFIEA